QHVLLEPVRDLAEGHPLLAQRDDVPLAALLPELELGVREPRVRLVRPAVPAGLDGHPVVPLPALPLFRVEVEERPGPLRRVLEPGPAPGPGLVLREVE